MFLFQRLQIDRFPFEPHAPSHGGPTLSVVSIATASTRRCVTPDKTRTLDALKHELDRLGSSELERLVLGSALSPAVAAALGVNQPNPSSVAPGAPENQSWPLARDTSGSLAGVPDSVELWHHVPLLPGLVLLLSSRANVAVRNAAKKIYDDFRA